MSDDDYLLALDFELTEDPVLRHLARAIDGTPGERLVAAIDLLMLGIGEAIVPALGGIVVVVLDVAAIMADIDQAIASSRARAAHRPTLTIRGSLAPPRDLRATEAPRRPPARNRRPRC